MWCHPKRVLLWTGILLSVGCGGRSSPSPGAFEPDGGAARDRGGAAGGDADQPKADKASSGPWRVDFEIVNTSAEILYLQHVTEVGTQSFLSLSREGEGFAIEQSCLICDCDACADCAICGRGLAMVAPLEPGDRYTLRWDGLERFVKADGCGEGRDCGTRRVASAGPLEVTVTFGGSVVVTEFDSYVGQPHQTARVPFDHPPPGGAVEVELR
jgi:hypothetical protein